MAVTVVISYDLVTPPGKQNEFKAEMKKLGWSFDLQGKTLPNTTCYAPFKDGVSESGAANTSESDIRKAEAAVKSIEPRFKVERFFIVAFPVPPSVIKSWP
jgi:hypothetical protein